MYGFFGIKFKIIFQKIRYNVEISLSSIADKEKMVSFWIHPLPDWFQNYQENMGIWMYQKKIFIKL